MEEKIIPMFASIGLITVVVLAVISAYKIYDWIERVNCIDKDITDTNRRVFSLECKLIQLEKRRINKCLNKK